MPWPFWLNVGCRNAATLLAAPVHNAGREIVLEASTHDEIVADTVQVAPEHKADREIVLEVPAKNAKKALRDAARARAHAAEATKEKERLVAFEAASYLSSGRVEAIVASFEVQVAAIVEAGKGKEKRVKRRKEKKRFMRHQSARRTVESCLKPLSIESLRRMLCMQHHSSRQTVRLCLKLRSIKSLRRMLCMQRQSTR